MIHSLVGQSEVLTLSGTAIFLEGHTTLGTCMIGLGVLSGIVKYASNMGIVSRHLENDEKLSGDEKSS